MSVFMTVAVLVVSSFAPAHATSMALSELGLSSADAPILCPIMAAQMKAKTGMTSHHQSNDVEQDQSAMQTSMPCCAGSFMTFDGRTAMIERVAVATVSSTIEADTQAIACPSVALRPPRA